MRTSKRAHRAFEFYVRVYDEMGGCEQARWPESWEIVGDPDGEPACEAFTHYESGRKRLPCREPKLLHEACQGKQIIGFRIGQWQEGIEDGLFCICEFKKDYEWFPEWVWKSVSGQAKTRADWCWRCRLRSLVGLEGNERAVAVAGLAKEFLHPAHDPWGNKNFGEHLKWVEKHQNRAE